MIDKNTLINRIENDLEIIREELDRLTAVNAIAHQINKIILENKKLTQNSILWWWVQDSFIGNVIIRLGKILEKDKTTNPRLREQTKNDINFEIILNRLKENLSLILPLEKFIHLFDIKEIDEWTKNHNKKQQENRRLEYKNLLGGLEAKDTIEKDLEEIKALRKVFKDFRDKKIAHLKDLPKDEKNNITYEEITKAIKKLQEMYIKYANLIMAKRSWFKEEYDYGNVFEIPWKP